MTKRRNKNKMKPFPKDEYDRHQALPKPEVGSPEHIQGLRNEVSSMRRDLNTASAHYAPKPVQPTSGRLVSAIRRHPGRTAAVVAGTAAAGAGTAILIDRHNHQKKAAAMSKNLINPFDEVVVFGKAYPVVDVTNVRSGTPKTHTGRGVGHGQRLTDVKNSKGGGGRATKLERYSGGHASGRVGPFGKSLVTALTTPTNAIGSKLGGSLQKTAKVPGLVPKPPAMSLKPTRSIGALPIGKRLND